MKPRLPMLTPRMGARHRRLLGEYLPAVGAEVLRHRLGGLGCLTRLLEDDADLLRDRAGEAVHPADYSAGAWTSSNGPWTATSRASPWPSGCAPGAWRTSWARSTSSARGARCAGPSRPTRSPRWCCGGRPAPARPPWRG